jgi:DNA-binding MarR family transcriptional regulator
MNQISDRVKFLVTLSKTQSVLSKRFDSGMGNGIGFNEFLILLFLSQATEQKMRRIDLADKIGITASGITRMLLPMEKIGLVKNGDNEADARVRFVYLSSGGKEKLEDALDRFEMLAEDVISDDKVNNLKSFSDLLIEIGGKMLMK